MRKNV
jgi:hypothetical protein